LIDVIAFHSPEAVIMTSEDFEPCINAVLCLLACVLACLLHPGTCVCRCTPQLHNGKEYDFVFDVDIQVRNRMVCGSVFKDTIRQHQYAGLAALLAPMEEAVVFLL
jgi:hypothetical protein